MAQEPRDYLELAFRSIECFSDDGKLDVSELERLVDIAERDGQVDDNEKRVLAGIFKRLHVRDLTPELQEKIDHVRTTYKI